MPASDTPRHPAYRLTRFAVLHLSSSVLTGFPHRSLAWDASKMLDMHMPRPLLTGLENFPHDQPFVVVANHYQRNGLWIGWPGGLICEAAHTVNPRKVPVRIVVTDVQRLTIRGQSVVMPLSGFFLGRIARLWGMIRMPSDPQDTAERAATLKHVLRVLTEGEPVLFFPEGDRGSASGLVEALAGTGSFLALASRRAVILPAAFWEDGPLLRCHVAPPLILNHTDDTTIRDQVMLGIGRLLPESLWGVYRERIRASLSAGPLPGSYSAS